MSGCILCHHSQDEVWQTVCKLFEPTVLIIFLTLTVSVRQSLTLNQTSYLNTYE